MSAIRAYYAVRGKPPTFCVGLVLAFLTGATAPAVGVSGAIQAQDAGPVRARLTLPAALALAERHNPAYRRSANELALNAIDRREAWLSVLPNPTLGLLTTRMAWNLQRVGTDNFGNPIPNPESRMVQSSQSSQRAALSLTVDPARLLDFWYRGEDALIREITASSNLHTLRADVWLGFLNVQQQQLAVDLEQQHLERQRAKHELARRLFALAQRQEIDVREAELDIAIQNEALLQARANLRTAILQLKNLIGDPDLEIGQVEPVPFRTIDPSRFDEEALIGEARTSNPILAVQESRIRAERRQVRITHLQQWLPVLSFSATTGRSELAREGASAFLQPNPAGGWDRNVAIQITFPDLARFFDVQITADRQEVSLRNAEETLREQRLAVEQDVRTALVELRSASVSVDLQRKRVDLAEQRLLEREEAYRLGRSTFQELQTASDNVAAAARGLLETRFAFERAIIALERTLGRPLESVHGSAGS